MGTDCRRRGGVESIEHPDGIRLIGQVRDLAPSGLAALLVASVPLWMALADRVINGQRIRPAGWLALVIGLAGVAIIARPRGHGSALPSSSCSPPA